MRTTTTTMITGTISAIVEQRGFGFIAATGEPDVFFHFSVLDGLTFDVRLIGQRVQFETELRDGKVRATIVRAAP